MGDSFEVDSLQREVFERAGFDADEPIDMARLARALGLRVETLRPAPFHGDGSFAKVEGRGCIFIRGGVSVERKRFACAHEIAESQISAHRADEQTEEFCNAVAAALIAPRHAFTRALKTRSGGWAQLALDFRATESLVVLREAEVTGTPTVLIAPATTRVRGNAYAWPPTSEQLRKLGKLPALPGMRRARLNDDPRRIVIEAEEAFDDCG